MIMHCALLYPDVWVLQTYVCGAVEIADEFAKP